MAVSVAIRWASGSTSLTLHVSISEAVMAQFAAVDLAMTRAGAFPEAADLPLSAEADFPNEAIRCIPAERKSVGEFYGWKVFKTRRYRRYD